jgi:hypothetical protein
MHTPSLAQTYRDCSQFAMPPRRRDHADAWYRNMAANPWSAVVLVFGLILTQSGGGPPLVEWVRAQWEPTAEQACVDNIINSSLSLSPLFPHVPRALDAELRPYIGTVDSRYVVLVGPRGCGKSVGIVAAAQNHTGVIRVTLSDSSVSVYASVLAKVCPEYPVPAALDEHTLGNLFRAATQEWERRGGKAGAWAPTVVAEVDRGATDAVVLEVAKSIKRLGSDTKSCRAVMVLSDAHAAFGLPKDDARIEIVWVGDLSRQEANTLLDHLKFLPLGLAYDGVDVNEQLRERVFTVLGTRPARLEQLVSKVAGGVELEAFLESVMDDARDILGRLTKPDKTMTSQEAEDMKQLARELLASPLGAVQASSFLGVLSKPNVVAELFKLYHAFFYHYPTKTYQFYAPAYRLAAQEMFGAQAGARACMRS